MSSPHEDPVKDPFIKVWEEMGQLPLEICLFKSNEFCPTPPPTPVYAWASVQAHSSYSRSIFVISELGFCLIKVPMG